MISFDRRVQDIFEAVTEAKRGQPGPFVGLIVNPYIVDFGLGDPKYHGQPLDAEWWITIKPIEFGDPEFMNVPIQFQCYIKMHDGTFRIVEHCNTASKNSRNHGPIEEFLIGSDHWYTLLNHLII